MNRCVVCNLELRRGQRRTCSVRCSATLSRSTDNPEMDYLYRDSGCEFSPSCLRCELPKCQYDMEPIELHRFRAERKHAWLRAMAEEGTTTAKLAEELGITQRSVQRRLKVLA